MLSKEFCFLIALLFLSAVFIFFQPEELKTTNTMILLENKNAINSKEVKTVNVEADSKDIKNNKKVEIVDVKEVFSKFIKYENYKVKDEVIEKIVDSILKYSKVFVFPPDLVIFVMNTESDFEVSAKSNKGAVGLMQVLPAVWLDEENKYSLLNFGIKTKEDLFDINKNIFAGVYILNHYKNLCDGDLKCALRRYFGHTSDVYVNKIKKTEENFLEFVQNINKEDI